MTTQHKVSFYKTNRPHIKGTNIPVEIIIGHTPRSLKREYPWLQKEQIEDALAFAAEWISVWSQYAPSKEKTTQKD